MSKASIDAATRDYIVQPRLGARRRLRAIDQGLWQPHALARRSRGLGLTSARARSSGASAPAQRTAPCLR
jgi:hypothetical protein